MTIHEFNLLTPEQKCEFIDRVGVYLAGRNEGVYAFNLYSIFSLYVELCYNFKDYDLERVRVFKNLDYLEPYMKEIILEF